MPRYQNFAPLRRPFTAPRTMACPQHFRFSSATRLCEDKSSQSSIPPNASPSSPSTPQEAARAADLAATEATTESDSAQPLQQKPVLPSSRPASSVQPLKDALSPSSSSPAPSRPRPQKPTPSPQHISLPPPRYHVSRSANKNLPIYTDYKRGGNLHLTTVRKITGDLSALRDELRVVLSKKNEDVKINSLTGHVVVKGHHTVEITEFLKARGM